MPEHPLEECPNALAPLWTCNQRPVAIYYQVATGFAADLHVGGLILSRALAGMTGEEIDLTLRQLAMIHASFNPPPNRTA